MECEGWQRMTGNGSSDRELSPKESHFLTALLLQPTIATAAKVAQVAERTAYRCLEDEAFQREYRLARRKMINQSILHLQSAATEAVEALRSVLNDRKAPPSAKVSAA